ncbi:MAG: hypothetical protein GDA36_12085 [Rhodobacteraceae bacterium]|nr:hypothetical protein [Paracoccaceae bacterium]
MQRLDTTRNAMGDVGLQVVFAELLAVLLMNIDLTDLSAWNVGLSPWPCILYLFRTSHKPARCRPQGTLYGLVWYENPDHYLARIWTHATIAVGFATPTPMLADLKMILDEERTGNALLHTMRRFDQGMRGSTADLTGDITILGAVGTGNTGRHGALQLLLLGA